MKVGIHRNTVLAIGISITGFMLTSCAEEGPPKPPPPAPPEYADKHMPEGYWNNPEILEQGKAIFTGAENIDVNCASCHGKDGKPIKAGARDFRRTEHMQMYSDSVWFWRVNEGVKGTKMKAWKSKLSEDEIWKVIAYESTFGLKGKEYDVVKKQWVAAGTATKAGEAPAGEAPMEGEASGEMKGEASGEMKGEAPGGESAEKAPE